MESEWSSNSEHLIRNKGKKKESTERTTGEEHRGGNRQLFCTLHWIKNRQINMEEVLVKSRGRKRRG